MSAKKLLTFIFLITLGLGFNGQALAATTTPDTINYQGRLLNASSVPITGAYTFRFSMWNSADWVGSDTTGGGAINTGAATYAGWQETHSVTVGSYGLFDIPLGSTTPIPNVNSSTHTYMQVEVKPTASPDTSYEILDPAGTTADTNDRKVLANQAYARNADYLDNAEIGSGAGNIPVIGGGGTLSQTIIPTDFSASTNLTVPKGSSDPATCTTGQIFYNTTGNVLKTCTATNVWTVTGTGTDAATVDGVDSTQFLRSDTSDNYTSGTLTLDNGTTLTVNGVANLGDNGDNVVINSNTWDVSGAGVATGLTGITSTGVLNFSGASSFRIREVADEAVATCTTVNELVFDTTEKKIYACTVVGAPGTWTSTTPSASDLEAVYATDVDKTLTTSNAAFTINTGTNDFVVDSNDWNVTATGDLDAASITSNGALTATGTTNLNGNSNIGNGDDTVAINSSTWDISGAGVASGLTGITSTGSANFSSTSSFRIREVADEAVATCTTVNELVLDTTENKIYKCTVVGAPGTWVQVNAGGGGGDATTLDTIDSTQFLRSDTNDTYTNGILTFDDGTELEMIGTLNASGADSFRIREVADEATAACTTVNELIFDTTEKKIYACTAAGSPGTWTSTTPSSSDFEAVYAADADNSLTTGNGDFTISSGTGNTIIDSNNWNVTSTGDLDAASITSNGSLTATGTTNLNGNSNIGTGDDTIAINSSTWDISGVGVASGLTGLTSTGTINLTGASVFNGPQAASDPGTCSVGQYFYNTTSNAFKMCTSTNTWTIIGSANGADLLDGLDSGDFLRSNASDNYTSGTLTFDNGTTLAVNGVANLGDNGDNVVINSNTWDVSGAGVGSGFTGFTSTGTVNFGSSSSFRIREVADEATAACTTVNELIFDTTEKKIYACTVVGAPGTWTSTTPSSSDFEAVYAADGDNTLTTANGNFTISSGTGDTIINSNDWNVTATGDLDAASITSNGALTATGATNLNGTANLNGVANIGDGGDTVAINSSTWDISGVGVASGLTGLTSTGTINLTGASVFNGPQAASDPGTCSVGQYFYNTTSNAFKMCTSTNTWTIIGSANGADLLDGLDSGDFLRSNASDNYTSGTLTFDNGTTLTVNGVANLGDNGDNVVINSNTWDVSGAGVGSGFTGFTSTGTVNFTGASSFQGPQGASDPGTCSVGQYFYNTTSNAFKMCTSTDTWTIIGSANGADLLDGVDSTSFLRSDASDNYTSGTLTFDNGTTLAVNGVANLGDNGDNVVINSNTWDVSGAGVGSGFTGFTSTGTVNFGGSSSFRMREVSNEATAACTTINEIVLDTTENKIYKCTAAGAPGTWATVNPETPQDFESVYSTDVDKTLTTGNAAFTINTGTNDFVVDSNDWNVTAAGDLDAASITSNGALTTTGTTNLNGTANLNGVANIGDNGDNVVINSNTWDVSGAGVGSGFTGFTSTGTINFTGASAFSTPQASSDPGTCTTGQEYYNTTTNTKRLCVATNTWSAEGATGTNYVYAYDTTTQTVAAANTWQGINFATNAQLNGWTHTAGTSTFTAGATGLYLVNVGVVMTQNTGTATQLGEIRATFNGTEVAGSHTSQKIRDAAGHGDFVGTNFILSATSGQNLVIQLTGNSTQIRIAPVATNGTADVSAKITIIRLN